MPLVTIRTGLSLPDGTEEVLTEYLCDSPDCPNVAVYPLGCSRELRVVIVVCDDHAPRATGSSHFSLE